MNYKELKMKKILFYIRNDAKKHVIIKTVVSHLRKNANIEIVSFMDIFKRIRKIRSTDYNLVYNDDPIAFFLFFIFNRKMFSVFHSLEMYEYQVLLNNPKRWIRFFIFSFMHKFSLKHADLIIFPNELRREYYLNKYSWLLKDKTKILENNPVCLNDNLPIEFQEEAIVKNFVSKFKATLVIAGAVGEGRNIKNIIEIFQNQSRFGLCVITQSDIVIDNNQSTLFFKNMPHEKILQIYQYFSAGLLYYENTPLNVKYCAPTKMYEYISNGLFIIGNDNFSLKKSGWVDYFYEKPKDIFLALEEISLLPKKDKVDFNFSNNLSNIFKELI